MNILTPEVNDDARVDTLMRVSVYSSPLWRGDWQGEGDGPASEFGPLQLGSMLTDATRLHIRAYLGLLAADPNIAR